MKKFCYAIAILLLSNLMITDLEAQSPKKTKTQRSAPNLTGTAKDSIEFGKIEAISDGNGVLIRWETKFEFENLGFDVVRMEGNNPIKVNPNLVPGTYLQIGNNSTQGNQYLFFDPNGSINSVYRIRNISINRKNLSSQLFYPRFEYNFDRFSNSSSEQFQKAMREANPVKIEQKPVLPDDLKTEVEANSSLSDINTQFWVASQPGVKIGVKKEGIYRVTSGELQAAGFDINSDFNNWQLYLNGVEQAINVVNGNYIEFYGKGVDTVDTEISEYFLITGPQSGKRIGNTIRRGFGGNVVGRNYEYEYKRKERFNYLTDLLNGDVENFFGGVISSSNPATVNFELSGLDFSTGKSSLTVEIQGLTNISHLVQIKVNGQVAGSTQGNNRNLFGTTFGLPISFFQNGTNTIEFLSLNGSSDINLVSSIKLNYLRLYQADQNQLAFYTRGLRVTEVSGFTTPDIRVFDITFPDEPTLITNATIEPTNKGGTEFTVSLPANRRKLMYAVSDSGIQTAASVVQNIPSTLSATTNQADMIIITHRNWLTEANTWAAYRQTDGYNVRVIDVEDTYDEFDFGLKGSHALRNFLEYASLHWDTPPSYVLFLGDASYDPKNYTGDGFHSYVPVRFVDTLYQETGSDEAIADFDEDGLSEIAIGRIPARVPQDVTNALTKVIEFEQDVAVATARGALCASDLPDGYDFAGLCDRVLNELPVEIPRSTVNRGQADAKAALLAQINSGKYIVNYSGHGSTGVWASASFFGIADVPLLTNQNDLSIFTMLTCLNGYFMRPIPDSLSEALLKSTTGGAVAVWSSSGSTTPDVQEIMARRFYNQLGNNPGMTRLGDLVKDAKAALVGGRDVRRSWVLLGDPALRVK